MRAPAIVTVDDVARAHRISKAHLVKIAAELSRRGYIETIRGRHGGMRLARRWMAAAPLQGIVARVVRPGPEAESDEALLAVAKATGGTVYHPSCTVRMGGDARAPLDARLRFRGIAGLRVVDASVFPDIPVCNINATVLSVAEKAADLMAEDMRAS